MSYRYCLVALLLSGCSRDSAPVATERVDRRWLPVSFDTVWTVGGNAADSTLGYPARLTSLDGLIIVSDPGRHRILALRASNGAVAWVNGQERGHAFGRPLIVWSIPGHRIATVDEETQRLTTIDSAGRTVDESDLPPSRFVSGMCALAGGTTLATSADELGPFYSVAADGKTATPVPFSVLGASGREAIVLQASLENNADWSRCVVAMSFGGGLALWNGSAFTRSAPYRERVAYPAPVINRQMRITDAGKKEVSYASLPHRAIQSALDVAMTEGRIRVLFGGATQDEGRIIDDYDDQTLAYLGSTLLPSRVSEFAVPARDLVVVLTRQHGFPVVMALRQRARTP